MVSPDPLLMAHERTRKALASEKYQEGLISQRHRLFAATFWIVVIIEGGLWYWDAHPWLHVVVPLLWIGLLIHNNALLLLHEFWEINDQIAGRKDDFHRLLSMERHQNDGEGRS